MKSTRSRAVWVVAAFLFLLDQPGGRPFNRHPYLGDSNHVGGFAAIEMNVSEWREELSEAARANHSGAASLEQEGSDG